MLPEESSRPLDRRTVLRGAAWAAPVIALAVAAPLASASDPAPAPVPRAQSAMKLDFDTWSFYDSGKGLQLSLQAPYVNWTLRGTTVNAVTLTLVLPKTLYPTGNFTWTQNNRGQGTWSVSGPVDRGSDYAVTLTWAGMMEQDPSQRTPVVTFKLDPAPAGHGTVGITSVVGIDSTNALISSASNVQSSTR